MFSFEQPIRIGGGNDCTAVVGGSCLTNCGPTDTQSHLYVCKPSDSSSTASSAVSSSSLSFTDPHLYSLNTNLTFNSPVTFGSVPGSTLYNSCTLNVEPTSHTQATLSSSNSMVASGQNQEKNQKTKYVDNIVDTTSLVIQSIWADQYAAKKTKLVSLRVFIQEVLRRSRTTYSTLQTALFYLFRVKNAIVTRLRERAARELETGPTPKIAGQCNEDDLIGCGRRMFLAALMVASKYLQDKNYRNRAWAKISGLSVHEINATEIAFLKLIDYNLFVSKPTFDRWYALLHSQVAGAATGKDDQQTPTACLAGDMLFSSSSVDVSADRSSSLSSFCSPAARVPSPSSTVTGPELLEDADAEAVKHSKDSRILQYVQAQKRLHRAPDSGVAMFMSTPEAVTKLSPEPLDQSTAKSLQSRPVARARHLAAPAAPVQSTNNVVAAPYLPGVRPVVRSTPAAAAAAAAQMSSSTSENGKRKHAELSMMDDGFGYVYSYESAIAAIQVPDVCSVPDYKKMRGDDDGLGFGYLGEDAAVVELY
ncbi:hypothetical protein BC936DRAFT_142668 [Jimgerdemannia flammicorona]|uniref:Cyclin-domain-containing protein n=1 Tax=Jimgerdemannia flammicorona TaxID=994334 RepID=A0A433A0H5_9FUNG|nr:hypothetical protein BC936DRAFT_142668 [Jimgerdemannia flammicorona]